MDERNGIGIPDHRAAVSGGGHAEQSSVRRRENALRTAQAVTDEQLRQLTREVREHNNFARRMPVVEEQIKVINHRLEDLEKEGAKS